MSSARISPVSQFDHQVREPLTAVTKRTVEGDLEYLIAKEPAPQSFYREGNDLAERRGTYRTLRVPIRDMRATATEPTLDVEGFVLRRVPTEVTDFLNDDQIRDTYHAEVEQFIKNETGATKVIVFDHTVRIEREGDNQIGQAGA